jgi:hypothetical protein
MVTQVLHTIYITLFLVLSQSVTDVFDVLDFGPLLLQYSLFLAVFHILGFASDNMMITRNEVVLLPSRPPKPRGYYSQRRKHRHYFRRKFRVPII